MLARFAERNKRAFILAGYDKNFIKTNLIPILNEPKSSKELSRIFNRSQARIQDILIELKKQKKIKNFRVRSVDYWTNNLNLIIISKLKNDYLLLLNKPRQTMEFAKHFKVDWKSSFRRLNKLQKLNLVRREKDKTWVRMQIEKTVHVI